MHRVEFFLSAAVGYHKAMLLSIEDLRVGFGPTEAVSGIRLHIDAGETLGLVGESGSGKSTVSLATLGLLGPAARVSGKILFDGCDLLALPERALRSIRGRQIAMIFQEPMTALNPVMSIGRQIAEAYAAHHPTASRREARQKTIEALEAVLLPEPARRFADYPHQFSGGQRQRILIAMALINQPRLLIADEPTTALDVTVQAQILALLKNLQRERGLAMLFISHDLAVVGQLAHRVAVLRHGQLVEQGPCGRLLSQPEQEYTKTLLAAVPTMQSDRARPLAEIG